MYRHCPSCTRDLGRNEALEHFPVGKRLAYDVARGRLWALCPRCRSWNLAPIEERWEAVEEAERSFQGALEGLSTENIALGRLPDVTAGCRSRHAPGPRGRRQRGCGEGRVARGRGPLRPGCGTRRGAFHPSRFIFRRCVIPNFPPEPVP